MAGLIDKYLGHLYPLYWQFTRNVLIRQARDVFIRTFHGDLTSFEQIFLSPAAAIIAKIKQKFTEGDAVSFKSFPLPSLKLLLVTSDA